MRILFAIHTWPPEGRGGTEVHARDVARTLMSRGHQVGVFARTGRPERPPYEVTTEVQGPLGITRINNLFQDTHSLQWVYSNRRIHEAFEREMEEFQPDLVHVHHLVGLSSTIIEAAKDRGLPVVLSLHDFWTICPRGQRMTRELELCEDIDRERCYSCLHDLWPHLLTDRQADRTIVDVRGRLSPEPLAEWDRHMTYVLDLCDLLVCPSEFHRERMLDHPLDPDRVISLPHGLDHGPFRGLKPREPGEVTTIGFIGAVTPVKGPHVLIEAFRLLGRNDLALDIYGELAPFHGDDRYVEDLKDRAARCGNVVLRGSYEQEDLPRILEGIDILVVPSLWWETFCLTLREGLLAGVPVVASDLGAMREALDGEQNGLLFNPGDAEDLAGKLQALIDDPRLRARYQNRGAAVKTLEAYAAELEATYKEAGRIAASRSGSLVVAPPAFPAEPSTSVQASGAQVSRVGEGVPWDRIGVALQQESPLAVQFTTRMPSADDPVLGVDIALGDGGRSMGRIGVMVDLREALGGLADSGGTGQRGADRTPRKAPPAADAGGDQAGLRRVRLARRSAVRRLRVGRRGSRRRVDLRGAGPAGDG